MATSNNSFANETFDSNVYWNLDASFPVNFPCIGKDPYANQWFLQTNEFLTVGDSIISKGGAASATMQPDGNFCVYRGLPSHPQGYATWCTASNQTQAGPFAAIMQGAICGC